MDDNESLSHSKWECKYHVVFIPKWPNCFAGGRCAEFLLLAGRVRWRVDLLRDVDSEHLAAYQALLVADEKYLGKEASDVVAQRGYESGDGSEVRLAVS